MQCHRWSKQNIFQGFRNNMGQYLHWIKTTLFHFKNSLRLIDSNQWGSYFYWHLWRLVTVQNSDRNYKLQTIRSFTKFSFTWLKNLKFGEHWNFFFFQFLYLKYSFPGPVCLPPYILSPAANPVTPCYRLQYGSNRVSDISV